VSSYLNGNLKKAKDLQLNMKPLIDALFIETNPIPIKEAMNLLGMDVGPLRLPLTSMVESNKKILMAEMKSYGLKI
jgi:4-hydroxy-tetrahydrodipicolinate synthase